MGGFSSNYEGGYLDFDDDPKWMNQKMKQDNRFAYLKKKKLYTIRNGTNHNYLNILLTTASLLTEEAQQKRAELYAIDDSDVQLELKHDSENLKIYYEKTHIGSVQIFFEEDDIDNTEVIHDFCFIKNTLTKIEAIWDGEGLYLKAEKK
ncbi:MAG: Unknown protein [uncultured Sulfurovum sp.]|uniref:Uncharacterized protein n=1 Tax=uncultured Sulfurovum sp. TaxID=269237 RepID=A0A6S6TVJ7_9BACT|nr:MAG: Unknown protein [uncultured Sulfurovum sp.]